MAADRDSLIRVFDKMTDGILVLDDRWRILYSNDSGRRYLGLTETDREISEDLRPKLTRDFVLSADLMNVEMDEEESVAFEATNPEDRSYDMTLSIYMSRPAEDGTRILLIRDITEAQHEDIQKLRFNISLKIKASKHKIHLLKKYTGSLYNL